MPTVLAHAPPVRVPCVTTHFSPMTPRCCADVAVSACPGARRALCEGQGTPRHTFPDVSAACVRLTCGRSISPAWYDGSERRGELCYNRALWRPTQASHLTSASVTAG